MAIALNVSNNETPGQNNHYLNAWQPFMMENIWLFNQISGKGAPIQTGNDKAGGVYLQPEREYIARALESAATRIAADLNYWPNPAFFQEVIPLGRGVPVQAQIHQGRWLKMIELGKRGSTLIQAGVAVVYSDSSGFGVNDTATITVATTVTDPNEVKVFFRVADGAASAGDYRYEIEPISVSIAGGVATITAHRALFVSPSGVWSIPYQLDPNFNVPNSGTTTVAGDFVTAVDVYRVYTDTSDNIQVQSADGTLLETYTGEIINAELSAFRLGALCSAVCWSKKPQRLVVKYKAGSPLVNGNIDNELLDSIIGFASCKQMSHLTKQSYWNLDMFTEYQRPMIDRVTGASILSPQDAKNPYGLRVGEVKAWNIVSDRRMERGQKLTRQFL